MRPRNLHRIFGAVRVLPPVAFGYYVSARISDIPYRQIINDLDKLPPSNQKAILGALILQGLISIPMISYLALTMANGVYDAINGTRHYVKLKVIEKISRNPTKKQLAKQLLEDQVKYLDSGIW